MSAPVALSQAFLDAYRLGLHDRVCRSACAFRDDCSYGWVRYTLVTALEDAVAHLNEHPRDAAGARGILHAAHCGSEVCQGGTHTQRWAPAVATLRRLLAADKMAA